MTGIDTETIAVEPVKREIQSYLDFDAYCAGLAESERQAVANSRILFSYPVLGENQFELVEQPVSQRILISVARRLGAATDEQVVHIGGDGAVSSQEAAGDPDWIIVHPMVGTLDHLGPMLSNYRRLYPNASIVLQNSDQHQHEKAIGGPRAVDIAREVLAQWAEIDWILVGFAEHTLAELLLARPTSAAINRQGAGGGTAKLFVFESLPEPAQDSRFDRNRTVRVQRGRGCLSPCTFCTEGQINRVLAHEKAWDGLGVEAFVERIEHLAADGHFFITITDSSFEDPGRRGLDEMRAFFRSVIDKDLRLSFKIHMRAENVLKLSDDDLRLFKQGGLDVIGMGVESVNADELALFRKIASRDQSLAAYRRIEATGDFCVILGFIMLSATSTPDIVNEKVNFLRTIHRGWDFLILTNRLQVFWGTVMHRELIDRGLSDEGAPLAGYAPYRFADPRLADIDRRITSIKRQRPEFMEINNLMYDAINLEARMRNPVNAALLACVGDGYAEFSRRLRDRQVRLSDLYCDGVDALADGVDAAFLADFDGKSELAGLQSDIDDLLAPIHAAGLSTDTLYLRTWMAVRDKLSVA